MPGGSILEAMAKAVEDASVVVMALSEKYKKSPNCRTGILFDNTYIEIKLNELDG